MLNTDYKKKLLKETIDKINCLILPVVADERTTINGSLTELKVVDTQDLVDILKDLAMFIHFIMEEEKEEEKE